MAESFVLEIKDLNKSYNKGVPVLNDMNLTIEAGKIIGLLGPNGCGKSTLIKLISGLLVPDSGEIKICGEKRSELSNALISYLPDRPAYPLSYSARQVMNYYSDFFEDFDVKLAEKMFEDLQIDLDAKLKTLSKGTRDKAQLVFTMARRAKLYLLDEPMAGIDPASRDYIIQTIICNYNPEAAVIIATHLIADIENTLDDFIFMGFGGRIIMCGATDETRAERQKSLDEIFREVFKC